MSNYLPPQEERERVKLYNQGLLDKDIAQILCLGLSTIQNWRKKRNLQAHGGSGIGGLRVNNPVHEEAIKRREIKLCGT